MAKDIEFEGIAKVISNLQKEIAEIKGNTLKGLIRGGIIVIRSTEKTPPLTPLDTGNLRASRFVVTSRGGTPIGRAPSFVDSDSASAGQLASDHSAELTKSSSQARSKTGPTVILGYTAFYAPIVHEMVGANFQRPGAGAKWLEKAIESNRKEILDVIKEEAQV